MMLAAVVAATAVGLATRIRLPAVPARRKPETADVEATARLLLIGLSAGLSLTAAMQTTADELDGESAGQMEAVLRVARLHGLARALSAASGELTPLLHRLARAQRTGAPSIGTIAAFIDDRRSVQRAEVLERMRRLPVTLTVPLALLILPGFILLTLGPTVATIVRDLFGGLL